METIQIDVTRFGADPSGKKDSTLGVQQALEAARAQEGPVVLNFPKGEYHFQKCWAQTRTVHTSNTNSREHPDKTIAILIENQKDLTIEGNGSLFLLHGNMMALAVLHSERITLRRFAWDFQVPTTVEVRVTGNTGKTADFWVPPNFFYRLQGRNILWHSEENPATGQPYWRAKNHMRGYCVVGYDPETGIARRYSVTEGPFARVRKIEELENHRLRVHYWFSRPDCLRPGRTFELCGSRVRETAGAFFWESREVTAEHIDVHYMHGFGWLTQMSHNVSFLHCRFIPREGTERLVTSFADLIHVSGASGKFRIEDGVFSHAHDDPINIHGTFTRVRRKTSPRSLKVEYVHRQQGGFPQYHLGDEVVFYSRDKLEALAGEERFRVVDCCAPGERGNNIRTMDVTFDRDLPEEIEETIGAQKKYVLENVTYTPEVEIRRNRMFAIPTRGILCTTRRKTVIEDNVFDGMAMAAIFLSNDSQEWYESGPIRDMTIRNNTFLIRRSGQKEWDCKGAVYIHPVTKGNKLPDASRPVHKNITIQGNRFYMEHDRVLKAESVENLRFVENHVFRLDPKIQISLSASAPTCPVGGTCSLTVKMHTACNDGDRDHLFEFQACKEVLLEGNEYDRGLRKNVRIADMPEENIALHDPGLCLNGEGRADPGELPCRFVSDDPAVAAVSEDGTLTGLAAGIVSVRAACVWDGKEYASDPLTITVQ